MSARDFPAPPSAEEIAARFAGSVFTLVPQPAIREAGWSTVGNGDALREVAASYSVFRNPASPDDPVNFVDDIDDVRANILRAERADQPEWFLAAVRQSQYPMAWEAVRSVLLTAEPAASPADLLAEHLNNVVMNTVPARNAGGWAEPPELQSPVSAASAKPALVTVDGAQRNGYLIDSDPDVVGWAARVGDCAVSLVLSREYLPLIDARLVTRKA